MSTSTVAAMPKSKTQLRSKSSHTTISEFSAKLQQLINLLSEEDPNSPVLQHVSQLGDNYSMSAALPDAEINLSITVKNFVK